MKNIKLVLIFSIVLCALFAACSNPIMEKWWVQAKEPEIEYVPIVKMIPEVSYQVIIQHEMVYQTIFVQLPPEVIHDTIVETQTIYEKVFVQLPPEVIHDTIIKYQTVYEPVYKEVEKIVPEPPTEDDIIQYIKDNPAKVIEIIKTLPNWSDILKEIIKDIPPEEIMSYLTEDQIKYIIRQQPPQLVLQTISVIDIEYIIFSGDASAYNGDSPTKGGTSLSAQEKTTNNNTVSAMAKAFKDNPDYMMILHGHANPTDPNDPNEVATLETLSLARAKAVEAVLKTNFVNLGGNTANWDDRVSTKGYGGENNLSVTNSTYAGLNRRVEMILVRVGVE